VSEADTAPDPLSDFRVTADSPDLLFQYFDPASGNAVAVPKVDKIPAEARRYVVVFNKAFKKGDIPPEQIIVADLTEKNADGTFPYRLVSRYSAAPDRVNPGAAAGDSSGVPGADGSAGAAGGPGVASGSGTVLVFTTQWCPHCREAVAWLKSQGIPFQQLDVENDPTARAKLTAIARTSGTPDSLLNTVPILYVNGRLLLGFDPRQVAQLLGL